MYGGFVLDAILFAIRVMRAGKYRHAVVRPGVGIAAKDRRHDARGAADPLAIPLAQNRTQRVASATNSEAMAACYAFAHHLRFGRYLLVLGKTMFTHYRLLLALGHAGGQWRTAFLRELVVVVVGPRQYELHVFQINFGEGISICFACTNFCLKVAGSPLSSLQRSALLVDGRMYWGS